MEAITLGLEAIALRLEAIALRFEAIAIKLKVRIVDLLILRTAGCMMAITRLRTCWIQCSCSSCSIITTPIMKNLTIQV